MGTLIVIPDFPFVLYVMDTHRKVLLEEFDVHTYRERTFILCNFILFVELKI
jgi:hypothetical protein